jgi:hypothetical protein
MRKWPGVKEVYLRCDWLLRQLAPGRSLSARPIDFMCVLIGSRGNNRIRWPVNPPLPPGQGGALPARPPAPSEPVGGAPPLLPPPLTALAPGGLLVFPPPCTAAAARFSRCIFIAFLGNETGDHGHDM